MNFLFKYFLNDTLIFNTSWEDPAIDRQLLNITSDSKILTICSAGDNVLEYLMDNPESVTACDINPAQTSLLELKIAAYKELEHEDFFKIFGEGFHNDMVDIFKEKLWKHLSERALAFWKKHIDYFQKNSFYYCGTSGIVARGFKFHYSLSPKLKGLVNDMVNAYTLNEQYQKYEQIDKMLFDNFIANKLLKNDNVMALLGIPKPQIELLNEHSNYESIYSFIRNSLKRVFRNIPLSKNYFWYLYIRGKYNSDTCPEYLKEENFITIKERVNRIVISNQSVNDTLMMSDNNYSHFILLDHLDWIWKDKEAQKNEWNLIKNNSTENAEVLFRTAADTRDFLVDEFLEGIEYNDEITEPLHDKDRVGTYGSLHYGKIK